MPKNKKKKDYLNYRYFLLIILILEALMGIFLQGPS